MEESSENIGTSSVSYATTAQKISELLNDDPDFDLELEKWLYAQPFYYSELVCFSKDELPTLIHLVRLCTLFPKDYDLDIEHIVQLFSAQTGAFWRNKFEDLVNRWFYALLSKQLLQPSYFGSHLRYKLNEHVCDVVEKNYFSRTYKMHPRAEDYVGTSYLQQISHRMEKINDYLISTKKRYVLVEDNINASCFSKSTRHASLLLSSSSPDNNVSSMVEILQVISNTCPYLQSLMVLGINRSLINQIPSELCLKLKSLIVLDLSYTSITELPSSFANLKSLRYLDVSGTLITQLPNAICYFHHMQTLKLRDCLKLIKLPNEICRLDGLIHLDLNIAYQLSSMPPGLGNLTKLQTLPAFIVGKEAGCSIGELKHMTDLRGDLCILRLENVHQDAKKAALSQKMYIEKLELQWTDSQDGFKVLGASNLIQTSKNCGLWDTREQSSLAGWRSLLQQFEVYNSV
ncbi:hypothetical protein Sjap_012892 [Stephania japonica]|uniref:Disease resistance R13L4/SHOC-2-like LRR domain-containing protein n=1 Tax=Stephania japonica TaxID=461633 RepID=A0AAP0IXQ1_9MAGN